MQLASCILPTYNRREFVARAVEQFRRQDYEARELIVVDDGTDAVGDLAAGDPRIRYIRLDGRRTGGAKRNLACREARGEIVLHWDDDDWAANWRISYQVRRLIESGAEICGLDRLDYYEPSTGRAWEYTYPAGGRRWVAGNTLCYRKSFWERHPFPDNNVGEDARFVWQARPYQVPAGEDKRFLAATVHAGNVSPKATTGSCWRPTDAAELLARMTESTGKRALVAAAMGIGDILRVTPLVRVLKAQGYLVDLLIRPDYVETVDLVRGAPDVCEVWTVPPKDRTYDVAAFSFWATDLARSVTADRKLLFDRAEWLRNGDSFCVAKIARQLGWRDPMPAPFAVASDRKFDIPPGTVAIHTGCKPDWPWKKWHGVDAFAALLPDVVVIGTPADLDNRGTYFEREFQWPGHVRNYVGKLSLRDTAALLKHCAALVSSDSGMMHLGAALGIPTVGVFGITSPAREGVPAKNLFPVTKGLACEAACRAAPWGRRDCEHHLRCLKELTAREAKTRLDDALRGGDMEKVSVTYYGHVHDASGYGNAARAYVHALDAAGVDVSVVDLSRHDPQVRDELVDRLSVRKIITVFLLFHVIPHVKT